MNAMRSTDIAEPNGQLLPLLNWSAMVVLIIALTSQARVWSPTAGTKTSSTPAMSPAQLSG
jgi:hypothetical protein